MGRSSKVVSWSPRDSLCSGWAKQTGPDLGVQRNQKNIFLCTPCVQMDGRVSGVEFFVSKEDVILKHSKFKQFLGSGTWRFIASCSAMAWAAVKTASALNRFFKGQVDLTMPALDHIRHGRWRRWRGRAWLS